MKFVVTAEQMRMAEREAVKSGIPAIELIKNAGQASYSNLTKLFSRLKWKISEKNAVILCGRGDLTDGSGGATGLLIAKHITDAGGIALCVFADDLPKSDEAREIYTSCVTNEGIPAVLLTHNEKQVREALKSCDLIIDDITGSGFNEQENPLPEKLESLFRFINSLSNCIKVSLDIPSGLNADTGRISEAAFRPQVTIQYAALKKGTLSYPAYDFCGDVYLSDLNIPEDCYKTFSAVITESGIKRFIPLRRPSAHKGSFGKLLNIAGSARYTGAALLSTKAALRTGVGITVLASTKDVCQTVVGAVPETVLCPLPEDGNGFISSDISGAEELLKSATAVLAGCGIGDTEDSAKIIQTVLSKSTGTVILDADGLNSVSANINILKENDKPKIITPHPAEFARLIGSNVPAVQANRIDHAARFAKEYGCITVLKGVPTVVAAPDGRVGVNLTGNTGLSKGGTGDVLAGITAAFAAGGVPCYEAALLGVYLHGLCAEKLSEDQPEATVMASDIIDALKLVMK